MAGNEEEGKKVRLTLDPDAAELLLRLAGSTRKQGEYISNLIRLAAKQSNLAELEESDDGVPVAIRALFYRFRRDVISRLATVEQEVAELKKQRRPLE